MPPGTRWIVLAVAWIGATFGILAIERISGDFGRALCGPWGCLPPLQALVAMHGFWTMVALPPTLWLLANLSPLRLQLIGTGALTAGLVGLTVVVARDLLAWSEVAAHFWRYAAARAACTMAMTTDMPFGQLALAGGVLWWTGRRHASVRATSLADHAEPPCSVEGNGDQPGATASATMPSH